MAELIEEKSMAKQKEKERLNNLVNTKKKEEEAKSKERDDKETHEEAKSRGCWQKWPGDRGQESQIPFWLFYPQETNLPSVQEDNGQQSSSTKELDESGKVDTVQKSSSTKE